MFPIALCETYPVIFFHLISDQDKTFGTFWNIGTLLEGPELVFEVTLPEVIVLKWPWYQV